MNEINAGPVLEFDNVDLTYHTREGETLAAKGLRFSVEKGEFIAVIGPSGCGENDRALDGGRAIKTHRRTGARIRKTA